MEGGGGAIFPPPFCLTFLYTGNILHVYETFSEGETMLTISSDYLLQIGFIHVLH